MLNTSYYHAGNHTCTNNNNIKINAVTGAILKNHPKSWFERFNLNSDRANALFREGGHQATKEVWQKYSFNTTYGNDGYYKNERVPDKDITILQMVICGDMEVMAELVYTKDYNHGVIADEMDKK